MEANTQQARQLYRKRMSSLDSKYNAPMLKARRVPSQLHTQISRVWQRERVLLRTCFIYEGFVLLVAKAELATSVLPIEYAPNTAHGAARHKALSCSPDSSHSPYAGIKLALQAHSAARPAG